MIQHRPTQAIIDLAALRHNVKEAQSRLPATTRLMAIIKADAYGHGAVMVARTLKGVGVDNLGVATVEEGIHLREQGIRGRIYVLDGALTEDPRVFPDNALIPVVHQFDDLSRLAETLSDASLRTDIHIKFDTGMGRLGFMAGQERELVGFLNRNTCLQPEGVMTHLSQADLADEKVTLAQIENFNVILHRLKEQGLTADSHIMNSAALIDAQGGPHGFARPGIMLYGSYPHPRHREKIQLKPVMSLKTRILGLRRFPAGTPISYGGTFVTKRDSTIAILPIGYADGYPRLLSNTGHVLIRGQQAPIVGRICMDLTMVDVTAVRDVTAKDEVILMGEQGGATITAEDIAAWAQTISYEILCGISKRVPRVYLNA